MPSSQLSHAAHTETQICEGRGEGMEGLAALVFGWRGRGGGGTRGGGGRRRRKMTDGDILGDREQT